MPAISNKYTPAELAAFRDMRVVLLTPVAWFPEPKFMKCVVDMMAWSWRHGLQICEMGLIERTAVDWARNALARDAVGRRDPFDDRPYTHALWLDCDHVFEPDLACQLARHQVDMVGALYYHRHGKPLPVVYVSAGVPDNPYLHHALLDVPADLIQVDAIGFGGLLMSMDVLRGIPEPWFTIDARAGEDIAFCRHAKEHGFEVYCDGTLQIGHVGSPPIVREGDYLKWREENREAYERDRIKVSVFGRPARDSAA